MKKGFRAGFSGGLEGSRTPNLLIRSQMLYPIKLQVRATSCIFEVQI